MHQQKNSTYPGRKIEELDDYAFVAWKNELERNLPNFWETIAQT